MDAVLILIPVLNLILGGIGIILGVYGLVKKKSILEMILYLSFGAAFATLGLLDLMGLMDPKWEYFWTRVLLGVPLILTSICSLRSPPSPLYPRWIQWAMLVTGAACILSAADYARYYYWH